MSRQRLSNLRLQVEKQILNERKIIVPFLDLHVTMQRFPSQLHLAAVQGGLRFKSIMGRSALLRNCKMRKDNARPTIFVLKEQMERKRRRASRETSLSATVDI